MFFDFGEIEGIFTHIFIHAKANQNAQTMAHTRAHKKLMIVKRNRVDLFPPPTAPAFQQPGSQSTAGMAAPMPRTQ